MSPSTDPNCWLANWHHLLLTLDSDWSTDITFYWPWLLIGQLMSPFNDPSCWLVNWCQLILTILFWRPPMPVVLVLNQVKPVEIIDIWLCRNLSWFMGSQTTPLSENILLMLIDKQTLKWRQPVYIQCSVVYSIIDIHRLIKVKN